MDLNTLVDYGVILTGVGTVGVCVLAIWGDWAKEKLFPGLLTITTGDLTQEPVLENTGRYAWYYHVSVVNRRRLSPVNEVELLLLRLERIDPVTGVVSVLFSEPIPIWWQRGEILPRMRKVGREAIAALFRVGDNPLQITVLPSTQVTHFPGPLTGHVILRVTLQACGVERDSDKLQLKIDWDGNWQACRQQMLAQHLKVTRA